MSTGREGMFGLPNYVDPDYYTPTFSGGDWETALPLENLVDSVRAEKARSTDTATASTQFAVDLKRERVIRIAALEGHNLSLDAQVRVRAFDEDTMIDGEESFDTGWVDAWTAVYVNVDDHEWEADNYWSETIDEEELSGYPKMILLIFDEGKYARYWKVEVSDEDNADGYVEMARLWLTGVWQPPDNFSLGAKLGFETGTTSEVSDGQVEFFDVKSTYRVVTIAYQWLEHQEAFSKAFEIVRTHSLHREFLWIWDPGDELNRVRHSFPVRMRELNGLDASAAGALFDTAYVLKEVL